MRNLRASWTTAAIAAAISISSVAYAGLGHWRGNLVPLAIARLIPRAQIKSVLSADKTRLMTLRSAMQTARGKLVQDLVAGNDTTADLQSLETAHNNLLAEKVSLAQNVLKSLTSDQRAKASSFVSQWSALEQSQRLARMQLFDQFDAGAAASHDDR